MKKGVWDSAQEWYSRCVGEKGHYYHQSMILKSSLRLLNLKKGNSLLDLGCGQGVLQRALPPGIEYCGVDQSDALLEAARSYSNAPFHCADASEKLPIEKSDFDAACFILSLQNMERPREAILNAASHLKKRGKLLLVLNHPCFRIPRQSHWGIDESSKIQYRRMNLYMTPQTIPIQTQPGRKDSPVTYSYHYPLSSYISFLSEGRCAISAMEEWLSDKKSEGSNARMEDRARREFPLFLALLAEKQS
jgi:SAM-dependent methyltransferase